jgi:hypothetical protein
LAAGSSLASFDHIAGVTENLGDAPGEFGVDVDLLGLDPAVTEIDPRGQLRLQMQPPIKPTAGAARHDSQNQRKPKPALARRRRLLGRRSSLHHVPLRNRNERSLVCRRRARLFRHLLR